MNCTYCKEDAHGRAPPHLPPGEGERPVCYAHCAVSPDGAHTLASRIRLSADQREMDDGIMADLWCLLCGQRTCRLIPEYDVTWWEPDGGWDPFLDRPYDK